MKVAIIGLGKMGQQISQKLTKAGFEVIAYDNNPQQVALSVQAGGIGANSPDDVVSKFGAERKIVWLMVPAQVVDEQIDIWSKILPPWSILIDGGNSNFKSTVQRAKILSGKSISYVDIGTSGGIFGLENGFSMMVGGPQDSFEPISPILDTLAKPNGDYKYIGESGAGHFVKMVHNAIEYGYMESLAEGFEIIRNGPFANLNLAEISDVWQHGSIIESRLNALAKSIFDENPELDGIDGVVPETGETRWTLELAQEMNMDLPVINTAFNVRVESQKGRVSYATQLLAALRNKFGGHDSNPK